MIILSTEWCANEQQGEGEARQPIMKHFEIMRACRTRGSEKQLHLLLPEQ